MNMMSRYKSLLNYERGYTGVVVDLEAMSHERLVKMHTQGAKAGTVNAPFSGRFRPQKRKSRRAVPGIKPGPAVILNDSISVWLNEDRYRMFMTERGRRMPTVEEQVSQEVSVATKDRNRFNPEGANENE